MAAFVTAAVARLPQCRRRRRRRPPSPTVAGRRGGGTDDRPPRRPQHRRVGPPADAAGGLRAVQPARGVHARGSREPPARSRGQGLFTTRRTRSPSPACSRPRGSGNTTGRIPRPAWQRPTAPDRVGLPWVTCRGRDRSRSGAPRQADAVLAPRGGLARRVDEPGRCASGATCRAGPRCSAGWPQRGCDRRRPIAGRPLGWPGWSRRRRARCCRDHPAPAAATVRSRPVGLTPRRRRSGGGRRRLTSRPSARKAVGPDRGRGSASPGGRVRWGRAAPQHRPPRVGRTASAAHAAGWCRARDAPR